MKAKALASHKESAGDTAQKGIVEKRQDERYSTALKGEAVYHSQVAHIEVVDMSKSGALLRNADRKDDMPKIGEIVDLSLIWPMQDDSKPLHVEGVVVRIENEEFAVVFGHSKQATLH